MAPRPTPVTLADFQSRAAQHRARLELVVYPTSADEVRAQAETAVREADAALAAVAAVDGAQRTFANTFAAVDAALARVNDEAAKVQTVAESSPDRAMRDAANEVNVKLSEWSVGVTYREDLYRALKAVADARPALSPEEQRLVDFTMRDYRRAGLALPPDERAEVEKLQKRLAALNTEFGVNINEARATLDFTAEELAGVPESFLEAPGVKQPDGRYRVAAHVTWHATTLMQNARDPETRRRFSHLRGNLAREKNVAVLQQLVALRAEIARRLGYANWADYQTETRMVKDAATAIGFEEKLVTGLQPKLAAELTTLRELKVAETGRADATLEPWDVSYFLNQLMKQRYAVDHEALRVYFPYEAVLHGMFATFERVFALQFTRVEPPYAWAPDVQLWVVGDSGGEVLGACYLDMFPREGKFNHFACFPQKSGGVLPDGRYDLPVMALLCNFPSPAPDKPSLLKHDDVVTLFHEFGHVLHGLLSRARFPSFSAFAVPRDFVEVPSQALECWAWDKGVLDTFAADYRDATKKVPAETIAALEHARQATEGYATRRQLAFGLIDLGLHALDAAGAQAVDVVRMGNDTLTRVVTPPTPDTAFVAYFGHLAGYDAGYYGYLWAKVLALDVAGVFPRCAGGYFDATAGRRLRDEIFAVGHTRDVNESVEKFLGRAPTQDAFLESVGIGRR
ncbi:MAG: Zn-dependent oligopeptidase [Candidatus Didemnitutus sp.]|nr:Zn-dependent oligopeptidase [Candidatus Didemnitutus sp.]